MGLRLLLLLILVINHPFFNFNFKLNFFQSLQQSFHSYEANFLLYFYIVHEISQL